jgi:hypothetical protein
MALILSRADVAALFGYDGGYRCYASCLQYIIHW